MRIVILDGFTINPGDLSWQEMEAFGEVTVYDRTSPEEVISRIGDAQAVCASKVNLTREVIENCPDLAYIGVLATGYNMVDLDAARERGITVTNIPAYSTMAVAQQTIGLLLELCLHIGAQDTSVHAGDWCRCPDFSYANYPLIELAGKTMGIIGFGRIGQAVARLAEDLGMEVLYHCPHRHEDQENEHCQYADLDTLFAQSDVISLHCPLTPDTENLIDHKNISKMKDGVMILNLARGPIVGEQDLADALASGKVSAAAADVVSVEPMQPDNPLLHAPNMILTPHTAWAPKETRKRLIGIATENLQCFAEGHPQNVVS